MTGSYSMTNLNSGSRWHRWEPHIHTPGTVFNDQFKGPDAWERYLKVLEASSPTIQALGVTDYYSLDSYERVLRAKSVGRLPKCSLIFPNIEMRLAVGTSRSWANIHLLVSPEDPDHISEAKRFMERLRFNAFDNSFACNANDLRRLGLRADPSIQQDRVAFEHGCLQFKVSLEGLQTAYQGSGWAQNNILIAVAGGSSDGTSGIRGAADTTLRQELEKFAHIIFSSHASQREYWLGQRDLGPEQIRLRYRGLKPCMHGCDAHDHRSVGAPALDRYSSIKGTLAFDALRQACIDPGGRAYVGQTPPVGATPSQVIQRVQISNACWAKTSTIQLNPGLIAIIGARGSGKTALADIIAAGCDAISRQLNKKSFLIRAKDLLRGASVTLDWEEMDEPTTRTLDNLTSNADFDWVAPRARYLSQQFVEDLCSSDGMTDALLVDGRVVFEAHDLSDRRGNSV